ncbi:30_t:CDS:2, partial [Ambispora gerdemannii]
RSVADIFRIQVISNTDVRSPIITLGSTSFFHVRHENLFVVAVTKCNANAALVFEFCYQLVNIGKSYFGKFDEESLLEVLDFGYPQNSEAETLKMYITTEEASSQITAQSTSATSWRRPGIKYRKNEAFIDVIESVNLLMSTKGTVLRSDVAGQIMMRAYLSGTPEYRTISFIPPDGEFELMRYRTTENVNLPFRVHPVVNEIGKSRVEYRITVKAQFSPKLYANNVSIRIPTPLNTANINLRVSTGKAKYVPDENLIVW